jgi:hypothetical protein
MSEEQNRSFGFAHDDKFWDSEMKTVLGKTQRIETKVTDEF